ncbi:MAG: phage tail protein [Anaerolineales bacterium]|nr:phage tail protein [Anaerolineales bacterium]MCA9931848.1 phage tail protein [Anaerolineales bacterium]
MSEPFIAEIRIFAGNFAPRGWAFCNGQLLPISQNTALFSLIGTTYGGDGRTTTALPDLQGRAPMHPGRGPGLTERRLGQKGGSETITLSEAQMPSHNHTLRGTVSRGGSSTPQGNAFNRSVGELAYGAANNLTGMASTMAANAGGSQAHNNLQPFLAINFIIALVGLYPSRD